MELLTGKSEKQLVHLKPEDVYSPEAAEKVIETDEKYSAITSPDLRTVAGLSGRTKGLL